MTKLFSLIFSIILLTLSYVFYENLLLVASRHLLVIRSDGHRLRKNFSNNSLISFNHKSLLNLKFSLDRIFHHDGIAYDYYSKEDLNRSNAGHQWRIWPLPIETNSSFPSEYISISPVAVSKLPFVDSVYVLTNPRLTERHNNLKRAFYRQGLAVESIEWRMKWNQSTCNSQSNRFYVYQRLNLKDKPLNAEQQRTCAITMEHVDVWYDMAEQKIPLGLILEDDAIFVPFFKEKFTRMLYAAIQTKMLRINGTCIQPQTKPISNDETIHQNPMIVIGTCFNFHGRSFQDTLSNASPVLTTHKSDPSRCTHAYLLTSCSAQALIDQIHAQKNNHYPSDFLQNHLFPLSPTLQSFWMDPPLVYQGNQVTDLDKLPTFASQTYKLLH